MQIMGPNLRPNKSEALGEGLSDVWFNKPSKWHIEKSKYIPLTMTVKQLEMQEAN